MPAGRPKKYTKEWIKEEADNFLSWLDEHNDDDVMWFKDFAIERGYDPSRLSDFAEESKEFMLAIKKARAIQEAKLARGALTGKLKEATSIFLMKSVHGHSDKHTLEHTGKDGESITINYKPKG